MIKKPLFLAMLFAGCIAACNSEKKDNQAADSTELIAEDTTFTATQPKDGQSEESHRTECYAYVKGRDTVMMQLNVAAEEYTGTLSYNFYEKDKNKGTFSGEMKGDTLIAEYIFDSEGMRSVREVVFLKRDGKLVEGFGDVVQKETKTVFKDRSKLKFGDAVVLSEITCK
ncbi:hypothetical protein [Pedobacter sp. JY14-1]|uniref:hypothetical protein n=1 Tax=Pedobacter sp. JY14-1 TaxID=3034151 RepID=UPI0023E152D9|nr:hypothetical protein [Pedobacter sp. JY14-1]